MDVGSSSQFLTREVKKRLGVAGKNPRREIESHVFFKGLPWDKLVRQEVPPPFVPAAKSKDATNFDAEFTSKDVTLTPPDPNFIAAIDQLEFEGFSYTNPAF